MIAIGKQPQHNLQQRNLALTIMMTAATKAMNGIKAYFAADAAAMPLHWIYDYKVCAEALGDKLSSPAFFAKLSCPFYDAEKNPGHYAETGYPSPYGEEGKLLLDFLVQNNCEFTTGNDFAVYTKTWAEGYSGRKNGWLNTLETNMDEIKSKGGTSYYPSCGADNAEANCATKPLMLAALYAGSDRETYLNKVEEAVRTHQNNQLAVDVSMSFGKMIWAALVEGASLDDSIQAGKVGSPENIVSAIDQAYAYKSTNPEQDVFEHFTEICSDFAKQATLPPGLPPHLLPIMGKSCGLPQSFIISLKLVLDADAKCGSDDSSFVESVEKNILFGGDCCGRNAFIVGIQSALGKKLPDTWYTQTNIMRDIEEQCRKLDAAGKTL
ncbi:hypothetical protein ACHAWF_016934 [Thalassiosira exigua]